MRENAICQHRRNSTYTVPYVPADWICAARDHEPRRLAERRSAAGMSRRRFDLKVEWDISRRAFDILFSIDLRQMPPRHSNLRFSASPATRTGLRPTRISTNEITEPNIRAACEAGEFVSRHRRDSCLGGRRKPAGLDVARHIPRKPQSYKR